MPQDGFLYICLLGKQLGKVPEATMQAKHLMHSLFVKRCKIGHLWAVYTTSYSFLVVITDKRYWFQNILENQICFYIKLHGFSRIIDINFEVAASAHNQSYQ